MNLKSFIKANATSLIVTFFCLGIFIGLSGSVALILLSFFIGVFFGLKIQAGNSKKSIYETGSSANNRRNNFNQITK